MIKRDNFINNSAFKYFRPENSPLVEDFIKMIQMKLSDISKCLTEPVIDQAFKVKTKSQDSPQTIEVTRGAPAGEGLLSAVYRIHITGHHHSASFIVKGLVKNITLRNTLKCTEYFAREAKFFNDILPALIEVQKSTGAKESIQNVIPRYYSCCLDGENDYILIEDLSEAKCEPMSEYPTENERNKVLKTLAHLHAVSIGLKLKRPNIFEKISIELPELYYNESNRDWYSPYQKNAVDIDRDVLQEYEKSSSIYLKKFDEIVTNDLYGSLIHAVRRPVEFPVLCHGDAWCSNFLCSGDRAVAIDFQLYRCASLATDLTYFIMMCSNLCNNKDDFLLAVDVYYKALAYYLKDMGFEPSEVFSRKDLENEINKYGRFGFLASLSSIPLMAGEKYDILTTVPHKVDSHKRLPLETLWKLSPIKDGHKIRLVNLVHVSVDVGLI